MKPDNTLMDKDGHCKLGDIGVSSIGIVKREEGKRSMWV